MDTMDRFGLASGFGSLGAGLGALFGSGAKSPYSAASSFFDRIPGEMGKYLNPYINAGQGAMGQLQGQYGNLVNDPSAIYNKLAAGYQQSPGYQFQFQQGMNAANNAAAAGGMLGAPSHQQQAATMANNLASQDFGNYMQRMMGLYDTGLSGLSGINQMGFHGSDSMAQAMMQLLQNQGALAYSNQAQKNQARQSMWGDLFGGAGAIAAFL